MYIFYDSKNILPVGIKLTGTLRLLLNAKNGKEIAKVGINESRNAINKAVLGDNPEAFTLLLLFAVRTNDDDDDAIDGNDAMAEDEEEGTNKSLSSSEVVMALGLVRTVPLELESGPCDI